MGVKAKSRRDGVFESIQRGHDMVAKSREDREPRLAHGVRYPWKGRGQLHRIRRSLVHDLKAGRVAKGDEPVVAVLPDPELQHELDGLVFAGLHPSVLDARV